ncbi:hypothetical protein Patl1_04881 [Pistacia atlantica]|uniref:Uncharacterized protein n=1 Tax=Pistacia atlantica TaxID=434234 RepID=A0ACC1BS09_9ROSI|nr:hypothetical protein Patl1_04881 [Pistacia atlantica]
MDLLKFSFKKEGVRYTATRNHSLFLRLEPKGQFNIYRITDGKLEIFYLSIQKLYGECIYPTYRGNYGVCSRDKCSCPDDSRYFKQLNATANEFSCAQDAPLSCQNITLHKFLTLENVSHFGFVSQFVDIDVESCKMACLNDCSCTAALFQYKSNLNIGNCSLPMELYSLRNNTGVVFNDNALAFIKVQRQSIIIAETPSKEQKLPLVLLMVLLVSAFLVLSIGACYCYKRWRKKKFVLQMQRRDNSNDSSSLHVTNILRKFSFEDLRSAMQNFQVRLGRGGFGYAFEGVLHNSTKVAVKRLGPDVKQGKKEILSEVETIGNIHHFNLVRLVGYCAQRSNRLLVYEYMFNDSIDK